MVKHVVIGAGLGGLYTVARLLNYGVALEHIIVIDPRANHYTRPGHLSVDVFSLFQEKTGIRTDNYSSAHHIKELERQMYAGLDSIDVQFIKERFIALQEQTSNQSKAVITEKEDGTHGIYPADVVFDCTGKPAHVAQAVNRYQQEAGFGPFFYSSLLTDLNPDTDHLIAQVHIANNSDLLNFFPLLTTTEHTEPKHYRQGTAEKNIETREQLKALGWPYEAFPAFYTYPQEGTDKLCLYMETPPDLTVELQPAWITLLLRIYSNDKVNEYTELEPSQKYEKKPRILGFKSTPSL